MWNRCWSETLADGKHQSTLSYRIFLAVGRRPLEAEADCVRMSGQSLEYCLPKRQPWVATLGLVNRELRDIESDFGA